VIGFSRNSSTRPELNPDGFFNRKNKTMEITKNIVDRKKESDGVWLDYDAETRLCIGSINSRYYKETHQNAFDELKRKSRKVTTEQAEKMQLEVYAKAILLDWSGITMKGQEYKRTNENALYLLENIPQLREFVFVAANSHENFRVEQLEEAKAQLGEP